MKIIDLSNTDVKHSFSREVAKKYGDKAALVFGYINHKLRHSKNERDGRLWYFNTIDNIKEAFPYLKRTAVNDALKRLTAADGLLITGNYNKKRYDRTTWYAFKDKVSSKMADKKLVYFKVQDAYLYEDVGKAVLLGNLRYWIDENRKENPHYCLHPMSPTELAEILPYSRGTIQRKLKELVEVDDELISVMPLDGRDPSKYAFREEVYLDEDENVKLIENPNKNADRLAQIQTGNLEGSNPNQLASNPDSVGANPDNYTTLIDNHLKEPLESPFERTAPLLRRGSVEVTFSPALKPSQPFMDAAFNECFAHIYGTVSKTPDLLNESQSQSPALSPLLSNDLPVSCSLESTNHQ